ncbi:MAG: beta strand repeat-containing protein [Meiothermus ruber]|uniref:beta strand repeat-containing protein n=1 Tax=Meiothermus ruber TaxID=277 RepID=UPI003918944A
MKRIYPILLAALLLLGLALAQQTPAGTNISNQASASYIDSAGQPRTTTSNQVITVVQQVYSFSITPDGSTTTPGQTRTALAGAPVYFSYTVSNTGNGTDTINLTLAQDAGDSFDLSGTNIYLDANCNGTLDPGETTPITSVTLSRQGTPGASACVIVAGTIPASATSGQFGNLNLVGTSAGSPSTTDTNNWARAIATTAAILTATKSASPAGPVTPGSTITYTISGANTGGSAASGVSVSGLTGTGILISDTIPTGLSVPAAPTGSAGAGTVQIVYSTNGGTTWSTTAPSFPFVGNGSNRVGMFISGSGAFFPQTASYTFSFQATVPANAPAGTAYPNTATVAYNDGTANQTTTSNTTNNTAASRYSVAIGGTGASAIDGADTQTIASANSGSTVTFNSTLQNTGNAPDSFTLSLGSSTLGACTILQSDGVTPLSGPVGPLAAGATYTVVVRCAIPASQTTGGSVTLTATSVNNPSGSVGALLDGVDATTLAVTTVVSGYSLDVAHNTNGASGGEGADPANDTRPGYNPAVNPGGVAYFPFEVSNTGANPDTYNLTASLPAGWTAVFYPDTNCDGVMDTPTPAPVSNSSLVNAGTTACFIAAVQVPAGAAPVDATAGSSDNVQLTITSTTLPGVSDTIAGAVDVNLVAQVSLTPDRSGTVTSPGTIQYTHTLTNNSNSGATCSISGSGGSFGWTYQYSLDGSTWAPSLSGVAVAANGGSQTVYVRILTPAGEPIGRTDVNTLTASCTVASTTATATASETTTVVGGDLRLTKSAVSYVGSSATVRDANAAVALPGDQILYTVVAQNIGTGNLAQVVVSDPLPSYTSFVSVSASISGFSGTVLYSTDGSTWSATAPTTLSAGQSIYVAVDTNGDSTITSADVMPPGATITLSFRVQVQ